MDSDRPRSPREDADPMPLFTTEQQQWIERLISSRVPPQPGTEVSMTAPTAAARGVTATASVAAGAASAASTAQVEQSGRPSGLNPGNIGESTGDSTLGHVAIG